MAPLSRFHRAQQGATADVRPRASSCTVKACFGRTPLSVKVRCGVRRIPHREVDPGSDRSSSWLLSMAHPSSSFRLLVICLGLSLIGCVGSPAPPDLSRWQIDADSILRRGGAGPGAFVEESERIPEFAGAFIEGCRLVVLATATHERVQAAADSLFRRDFYSSECGALEVELRPVRYPWKQLQAWNYYLTQDIGLQRLTGVSSVRIDMHGNRLAVGVVDSASLRRAVARLNELELPRDAVVLALGALTYDDNFDPNSGFSIAVYDTAFNPVPGVFVTVSRETFHVLSAATHPHGDILLAVPEGRYSVRIEPPPGWTVVKPGSEQQTVLVFSTPSLLSVRFVLRPEASGS